MKWDMEVDEIEAVLEKIWDLHDKLSDAILLISRTHFLNSLKSLKKSERKKIYGENGDGNRDGFVFVKDFRVDGSDLAIQEAKSLNEIRTALENLEDQLEFFHIIQAQQRAERDAAIARIEQSRVVLAMRLAEHHGKKYDVIEEALAFVGDVRNSGHFVSPENLYSSPVSPSGGKFVPHEGKKSNMLINVFVSSFNLAKKSLNFGHMGGVLGNAALVAVSMIAMLHLHQVAYKDNIHKVEDNIYNKRIGRKSSLRESSSSNGHLNHLDVLMAQG
ncbi:plastid division protein PDV1 isoform X2 [Carica papaya]|nr:plastid division protein PDV1 isoform X2 [Carica papaya]